MSETLRDVYEVKTDDKELHVINVMLEAMNRHLAPDTSGGWTGDIEEAEEACARGARYVMERMDK